MVRPLRPLGTNLPFWVRVYLVKCAGGIPPDCRPIDDEVRSVLDSPSVHVTLPPTGQRSRLDVSERGVAVDDSSDQLGQGHGFALSLARDVTEAVDQRHVASYR